MGNPYRVTIALTAAVANGISVSQSLGAAGNLTITGSLATGGVATLSSTNTRARRVAIASAGNDSGITWTITGTDAWGNVQSETLAGANIGTAQSVRDYATVTKIRGSGATASTVTAGTSTVASTEWRVQDMFCGTFNIGIQTQVTGTVNYSIEYTFDDPNAGQFGSIAPNSNQPPIAEQHVSFTGVTAAATGSFTTPIFAARATINSGTGTLAMQLVAAGLNE